MNEKEPKRPDFSEINKIKKMFDEPNIKQNSKSAKEREQIKKLNK